MILEDHPPGKLARCTKSQQCSPSSQSQTLLLFLIAMVMVGMIKKKTMKKEQRWRWKLRNKPMLDLTSIQVLQGMEKFQLEVEELLSPLYLCTFEFVLLCIMWKRRKKDPIVECSWWWWPLITGTAVQENGDNDNENRFIEATFGLFLMNPYATWQYSFDLLAVANFRIFYLVSNRVAVVIIIIMLLVFFLWKPVAFFVAPYEL